ncbi:hypothetical protein [Streptomyces lateritius]|uniref:hypothetical protein n=1 Tax=Streptomyces lateritius TaxID=67313 RepID=UPI00167A18DE|nr:hypothetical protein [Streptomyces lateritius]
MDAVIAVRPEVPSEVEATPARRPLPVLDMDEVCRELAECLAYIEDLPRRHAPDGQPLEPPDPADAADAASGRPPTAPHRPIPVPTSS